MWVTLTKGVYLPHDLQIYAGIVQVVFYGKNENGLLYGFFKTFSCTFVFISVKIFFKFIMV